MLFNQKTELEFHMNKEDADKLLQNVFEAAGKQPNTIPFDKLLLRRKIQTTNLFIARGAALIILILTFISPLVFRQAQLSMRRPVIIDNYLYNEQLYITISSHSKGVDYEKTYAKNDQGTQLLPTYIDRKNRLIAFDTEDKSLNIYITNYAGNITHAIYTSNE